MNNARRKEIKSIISRINSIKDIYDSIKEDIQSVKSDEEDAYYNLPENLQESDRGCTMSECMENLDEAYYALDDLDLDDVISTLGLCL